MTCTNHPDAAVNYYGLVENLVKKQGWISISLIQRTFKLSYGYTLSLVDALKHKGVVTPADADGKYALLLPTMPKRTDAMPQNNTSAITKSELPALARKTLEPLLDQPGGILYSSHLTLQPGKIYLMGLNPGGASENKPEYMLRANIDQMLSNTQNAYLNQCWGNYDTCGTAPLQRRVKWLLEVLGENVQDVFATNLIFTQSRNDNSLTQQLARQCWPVHEAMLEIVQPSLIVTFGNGNSGLSPYSFLQASFGGQPEDHPASHGNWRLSRFHTTLNGRKTTVIGLPHLSRYQPMGKPDVEGWLKSCLA